MSEVPAAFWQGVEQFNQGEFYACHDTLETIWLEAVGPQRNFYQGILQIAVGIYHLSNANARGAMVLLGEGVGRLRSYEPDYAGVAVSPLIEQSLDLLETVQQADSEAIARLADRLRPDAPDPLPVPKVLCQPDR
ncbi:DUF309 domain-containing protein [Geitlerinema sp. PCC 7407]|uniref:DUF309 domain-containing protein n=1 Tax=Geitlerinema sp. PCC 7407 TaxID=1173025 RepID=UPI00029F8876|nr:DUF309 domain-containing protein [Geitlerinema sp. PCC 7407]AFY65330.1 protein of unknown function DUF309 [Geitlerinema sp. PCC 7407]